MYRGKGDNRRTGGNRGGGGGGGRHYAARGQSAHPPKQWVARGVVGDGALKVDASAGAESSNIGEKFSEKATVDGVTKKFYNMLSTECPSEPNSESHGSVLVSPNDGNFKRVQSVQDVPETGPKPLNLTHTGPCYNNHIPSLLTNSELNESSTVIQPMNRDVENCSPSHIITTFPQTVGCQFSLEVQSGKNKLDSSDSQHDGVPFDICLERSNKVPKLKPALHIRNKARRNENCRVQGDNIEIIRPGMILLKGNIALPDQVKLVKAC